MDESKVKRAKSNLTVTQKQLGNIFDTFFRATGLSIFNFILRLLGHESLKEDSKIIIRRGWTTALIRNVIHLVPVSGAVTIAYLNITGFYIGSSFGGTLALQFAAKLHEMLMIASLSEIMLFLIRNELVSEHGLPFGALVSGFRISQLHYLWSLEIWGFLTASAFSWWRKLRFLTFVVICITLAASVGPSSAVGIIPRVRSWSKETVTVWSNATADQLFPANISANETPKRCANTSVLSTPTHCPWNEWQDLLKFIIQNLGFVPNLTIGNNYTLPESTTWIPDECQAQEFMSEYTIPSLALSRKVNFGLYYHEFDKKSSCSYYATTQHAAIADAFSQALSSWREKEGSEKQESSLWPFLTTESTQPFVNVTAVAIDEMNGPEDLSPVKYWAPGSDLMVVKSPDIYNTPGDLTKPRLAFVDLVSLRSGAKVLGAAVLDGRNPQDIVQRLTIYQIEASWSRTLLNSSDKHGGITVMYPRYEEVFSTGQNKSTCLKNRLCVRPISISKEWAMYTNPFVPELNASIFTAVHEYYSTVDFTAVHLRYSSSTAILLASLIANGISNIGPESRQHATHYGKSTYSEAPRATPFYDHGAWDNGSDTTHIAFNISFSSYIEGYSYNHDGVFIKIALVALLTYASIATAFVIYTSIRGISSSSWDSISELIALAINSPPSSQLADTCGGITSANTYKSMARVLVVDSPTNGTRYRGRYSPVHMQQSGCSGSGGVKHAQLVFRDSEKTQPGDCEGKGQEWPDGELVRMNERYGACPG